MWSFVESRGVLDLTYMKLFTLKWGLETRATSSWTSSLQPWYSSSSANWNHRKKESSLTLLIMFCMFFDKYVALWRLGRETASVTLKVYKKSNYTSAKLIMKRQPDELRQKNSRGHKIFAGLDREKSRVKFNLQ